MQFTTAFRVLAHNHVPWLHWLGIGIGGRPAGWSWVDADFTLRFIYAPVKIDIYSFSEIYELSVYFTADGRLYLERILIYWISIRSFTPCRAPLFSCRHMVCMQNIC